VAIGVLTFFLAVRTAVPPSAASDGEFAESVRAALVGDPPSVVLVPPDLAEGSEGLAYAALRIRGLRLAESWQVGADAGEALANAIATARAQADPDRVAEVDTVEISIAGRDGESGSRLEAENLDRGVLGLQITLEDGRRFVQGPTEMIAENRSFDRVLELLVEDGSISEAERDAASFRLFPAPSLLVRVDVPAVTRLVRGNLFVAPDDVTQASVTRLADGMSGWLGRQVGDDGRMVYEYWPSRGQESDANNMIRQWMATIALIRSAEWEDDDARYATARRNIEYNLAASFSTEGDLGLIADPDGDVKLGAVALAALAISLHPDRDDFAAEEAALRRTVDRLWQEDGSFTTFYRPEGRNDNQNFYPGEALLLWASTLEERLDATLLDRFMQSFNYYRDWHRAQPNPAFVPWHSMAYERVWQRTGATELRDFVFEMNDWLLDMQQWDDAPSPDVAGRFFNPDRPDYGPPHASSDGVYLEGLIAAYRLASSTGDEGRADAYRTAIARGLRHLMQLQFTDDVDLYYVSERDRVLGGLRTTVYDNRIRVDNVQHGYLAVLDILEEFTEDDYRTD
jgi:hypothetical protein